MKRWIKNKTGQIAILLAMSFGLMVLLIAMVINIGFLVATKINLQNSTDLAAYAGAAQQARYLTELGKWNYEMRRNYKAMVFDYLLMYNGELTVGTSDATNEFKMYVNNMDQTGSPIPTYPIVCASLQGQSGDPFSSTSQRKRICQKMNAHSFQGAVDSAADALTQVVSSSVVICSIDPSSSACQAMIAAAIQTGQSVTGLQTTQGADLAQFKNYRDGDKLNYTLRLLGWTLHDYRHMQSRIRGVHYGDISLGKINVGPEGSGRWAFAKDNSSISYFKNSPMSVAAKVVNGFVDAGDTATKLSPGQANYLEADGELIKNPVNDAALTTFKNNLLNAILEDARLYQITPQTFKADTLGNLGSNDMGGGCGGECDEFTGPYLKVNRHDVNFFGYYTKIDITGSSGTEVGTPKPCTFPRQVTNFPVGIAKDNRVLTYYAVVGIAKTKGLPFNVFFGNDQSSNPDVFMVAVAAARPFGSRIGPFIDETCNDLYYGLNQTNCVSNGLDPLYPFKSASDPVNFAVPNFSILETGDTRKLGVKLSVGSDEYGTATGTFLGQTATEKPFSEFYGKSNLISARARDFRYDKSSNFEKDDGFDESGLKNPKPTDTAFFDHDNTAIHPAGSRNSVWAWNASYGAYVKPVTIANGKRENYEGYLELAATNNKALYQFPSISSRRSEGLVGTAPYSIYVFRYPGVVQPQKWDISGLTALDYGRKMEYAFANTMAVNLFEIKRYILPYKKGASPDDVMNYINTKNSDAYIYNGSPDRSVQAGQGNKKFQELISGMENNDSLLGAEAGNTFGESYTSWRIGSRGYRVKLVNVQDLTGSGCTYKNCLSTSYTIDDTGGEPVTVDLSKIFY